MNMATLSYFIFPFPLSRSLASTSFSDTFILGLRGDVKKARRVWVAATKREENWVNLSFKKLFVDVASVASPSMSLHT